MTVGIQRTKVPGRSGGRYQKKSAPSIECVHPNFLYMYMVGYSRPIQHPTRANQPPSQATASKHAINSHSIALGLGFGSGGTCSPRARDKTNWVYALGTVTHMGVRNSAGKTLEDSSGRNDEVVKIIVEENKPFTSRERVLLRRTSTLS